MAANGRLLPFSIQQTDVSMPGGEVMSQSRLAPMLIVNAKIVMLKKNTITQ